MSADIENRYTVICTDSHKGRQDYSLGIYPQSPVDDYKEHVFQQTYRDIDTVYFPACRTGREPAKTIIYYIMVLAGFCISNTVRLHVVVFVIKETMYG